MGLEVREGKNPSLIMLCGLSGSGKSTLANEYARFDDTVVLSSDTIRKELYGSEEVQDNPQKVFQLLYQRAKEYLLKGMRVVYDATNLVSKRRKATLDEFKHIPNLQSLCVVVVAPFEECLERNAQRERKVPDYVIKRQLSSFEFPMMWEGWAVKPIIFNNASLSIDWLNDTYKKLVGLKQLGKWHLEDADRHTERALRYAQRWDDKNIETAVKYHDVGKVYTRTEDENGNSHFYGHEHVSAYLYASSLPSGQISDKDYNIITLIQYHDISWKGSKVENNFYELLKHQLNIVHECDMYGTLMPNQLKEISLMDFIDFFPDWKERIAKEPFNVAVKEQNDYVLLKYNQLESDFSYKVVQQSRGCILKQRNGEWHYVCRPFDKFFNYGEELASNIDWKTAMTTEKVDGCVDENTSIITNYGLKTIKSIINNKNSVKVLTYNHSTDTVEFQQIEGFSVKDNDGRQWYEIETDFGNIRLTGNHKVFCVNEDRYKRVDELDGSEELQIVEPSDFKVTLKLKNYDILYKTICEDIGKQYLSGVSIYELSKKYGCSWKLIEYILKNYYNLKLRNIQESVSTAYTKRKRYSTIMEKYGCKNPSQNEHIKQKKTDTFLKRYGVTNIRKLPEFYTYVNDVCMKRYGKKRVTNAEKISNTRREKLEGDPHYYDEAYTRISQNAIKRWNTMSLEQQQKKVEQLHSGLMKSSNLCSSRSKIEKRVFDIVSTNAKCCKHTFWINTPHKYSYDILMNNNIIIEINGDYWHANPLFYKADDILNIRGTLRKAEDIWKKDSDKKKQAENLGYCVVYLWENELKHLTDSQIWGLIEDKVKNYENSENKSNQKS